MEKILYQYQYDFSNLIFYCIWVFVGLIFMFSGKRYLKKHPDANTKDAAQHNHFIAIQVVGIGIGILSLLTGLVLFLFSIHQYRKINDMLKSDSVNIVEGYVENYHPMPSGGHDTEHFDVNQVHFEYSDYEIITGYHKTATNGGVIKRNQQHVKIKYYTNTMGKNYILYIAHLQ